MTVETNPLDWGRNLIIDPPSGWKYGFPKPLIKPDYEQSINDWLLENGYPKSEIDKWKSEIVDEVPCRYWEDRRQ